MKLHYYGQSCFLAYFEGERILFDPFITGNPLAKGINPEDIDPTLILISHGHNDHTSDLIRIAKRSRAPVVCVPEIAAWLKEEGIENTIDLNIGGTKKWDWGSVKMVNATHTSSLKDGRYAGQPAGFVVQSLQKDSCFYFAGDTALSMDIQLIPMQFKLNFCMLPLGDHYTMGVEDAVLAAKFAGCDTVIGMHYDSFPPIKINHDDAIEKFAAAGLHLHLIPVGSSLEIQS